jgi:hypothetical protein
VAFDVLGGLQRNDRVKLGQNDRPMGWIAYVSPHGMGDVAPIPIVPEFSAAQDDRYDPYLNIKNLSEAERCLMGFANLAVDVGLVKAQTKNLLTQYIEEAQRAEKETF